MAAVLDAWLTNQTFPRLDSLSYSVVIATLDRPGRLQRTLHDLGQQSARPESIFVVDASGTSATADLCRQFPPGFVRHERAERRSAAQQRNQGARRVTTPLLAFVDDDVELPPATFARLLAPFARDPEEKIGGTSGRIRGLAHRPPCGAARWYYRLQAGYPHPTYAGRLFGAGINCLPCYDASEPDEFPVEWLNAGCTVYRTNVFRREEFPAFESYSFMEDAHLSWRIGRTHRLLSIKSAEYVHIGEESVFKRDFRRLAAMRLRHRRIVARDLLRIPQPRLGWLFFLARLFDTAVLLRARPPGWVAALRGTWL